MKLLLTNPAMEGNLIIEEITYTRQDENHEFERFIVIVSQQYHAYKKY
jgi:hypothetical protein